ncbi:MAG: substrate-binding domain-containing protein [Promethearchaeota archaeon]
MKPSRKAKKRGKSAIIIVFLIGFIVGLLSTNFVLESRKKKITITIIYSSEKASWMTIAYSDFMSEWQKTHPDEKITIDMHPYGSSDSIISILNNEIYPTIWSPASSIWLPILNTKWRDLTKIEEPIVNISEAIKIIYSPVVIATWQSFNQSYNIRGFSDIYNLSVNPNVDVKMAHTDPRLSNSGFMSVIMALSAASGVSSVNLSIAELTNTTNQKWFKKFESSAVLYGKSTGFLARYMQSEGPRALNIVFLYENLIRDISSTSTGGKVIAIYPKEGTLLSDHPFCILNAEWVTPERRAVAEAFLNFLNESDTVKSAIEYGFRPINPSIPLDPNVFNYETNGIALEFNVPILEPPNEGNVLLKIPDFWLLTKATG